MSATFFFSTEHDQSLATITRLTVSFPCVRYSAARTHSDIGISPDCFMLSMYCFRGRQSVHLLFMYPTTTVFRNMAVIVSAKCQTYDNRRLRRCPSNSRVMPSSFRML